MIKNIYIKKILKNSIFKCFTYLNKIIPKRDDYILLYSGNKGISFNLLPLKEYLLKNNYHVNNKIICGVENKKYAHQDGCKYVTHFVSIYYFLKSKHVFYTAGQIPIKPSKTQIILHLQHGTTFKSCGALTKINNGDEFYFSKCMATSKIYESIYCNAYNCNKSNIAINSEPVTDVFFKKYKKYDLGNFKKILLWVPTFRQSDYLGYDDSTFEELIPLFTENDYPKLNDFLKKLNYKLIVKLHPSQNLERYKQLKFSNLEIMSNEDFEANGFEIYNLLPQIDLLIADYSSLFLQFLLLDKPILFVIPDLNEYSIKRGFAFDNPEWYMPGERIQEQSQFYNFLKNFDKGIDNFIDDRQKIKKIIHKYSDGNSCERLIKISEIKKDV